MALPAVVAAAQHPGPRQQQGERDEQEHRGDKMVAVGKDYAEHSCPPLVGALQLASLTTPPQMTCGRGSAP